VFNISVNMFIALHPIEIVTGYRPKKRTCNLRSYDHRKRSRLNESTDTFAQDMHKLN